MFCPLFFESASLSTYPVSDNSGTKRLTHLFVPIIVLIVPINHTKEANVEQKLTVKTQLRLTSEIHTWVTKLARMNDRSMNAEIVRTLKKAMQTSKPASTNT